MLVAACRSFPLVRKVDLNDHEGKRADTDARQVDALPRNGGSAQTGYTEHAKRSRDIFDS